MTPPVDLENALLYAIGGGDPAKPDYRKEMADVREVRRDAYNTKRVLGLARMLKGGSAGAVSVDEAFNNATDTANMGGSGRLEDATPHTLSAGEPSLISEDSRSTNRDGRSTSTAFTEFERSIDKDPVVAGPMKFSAQKTGWAQERQPDSTPVDNGPSRRSDPDARSDFGGSIDHFDREVQRGGSKRITHSSLAAIPYMKAAADYRKRVDVFILDEKNRVLAGKHPKGSVIFPGGGVEEKEQLLAAGKREALEEVGRRIKGLRKVTGPIRQKLPVKGYKGTETTFLVGKDGGRDTYLHGADDGFKMRASFRSIDKVLKDLKRTAATGHAWASHDRASAAALEKVQAKLKKAKLKKAKTAGIETAFKVAVSSGGTAAFDDRGTTTETSISNKGERANYDTAKEREWLYDDRQRNIDEAFRSMDAPGPDLPSIDSDSSTGGGRSFTGGF